MPDDGVIRIGTSVDISAIKAGMAEAQATVKASTSQMSAAYAELSAATVDSAAKQLALRSAIRQVMDGAIPYAQAAKLITPTLVDQTEASKRLAAAKAELTRIDREATASETQYAMAQMVSTQAMNEASAATGTLTGKFYAAQGASALLAGRVPIRAFERFLSVIPMVNDALAVAFPVIGAIALVELIGEGISKIEKMRQAAQEAADNIRIAFRAMTDEVHSSNDSLLTQTDRLQGELDKLLKVPGKNELTIAFDEATEAADRLSDSIDKDLDRMYNLVDISNKKNSIGFWESFWSGKAETGDTQKTIQDAIKGIQAVQDEHEEVVQRAAASGDKENLAQAQEAQLVDLQSAYKKASDTITAHLKTIQAAQYSYEESSGTFGKDQTANINLLSGALRELAAEQQNIGEQFRNENLQQKVTPLQAQASEDKAGSPTRAAFLSSVFENLRKQTAALKKDTTQTQEEINAGAKREADAVKRAADLEIKAQQEALQAYRDKARQIEDNTKLAQDQITGAKSIDEAKIAAAEAAGSMSKLAALEARAAAEAKAYSDYLKVLNGELNQLTYGTEEYNKVRQQIAVLQNQATVSGINNTSAVEQQIAQPYLNAFNTIDDAWLRVQTSMMYSTRNLSLEFARAGQNILVSITGSLEKALLKHYETEAASLAAHKIANLEKLADDAQTAAGQVAIANSSLMKRIAIDIIGLFHHTATNTAKTASDATSAAAATAATIPANIASAQSYAAVAAVAAMASAAAIPVVGWAMAPAIGASTLAIGEGFTAMAAFESGSGYIPRDGMAMLHEGESVIPAPTMEELRGSPGSGDVNLTQNNHFHGFDPDREFQRKLDRNAAHVARAVQRHMRQSGRG